MKLHIPEPCHEDWSKMTPVERGRHCDSCAKDVYDFTTMPDDKIVSIVTDKSQQVCGRITTGQMHRINSKGYQMMVRPAAMLAIITSTGLSFLTGNAMAQDGVAVKLENQVSCDSINVSGTVIGSDSSQLLAGVKVVVKIDSVDKYIAYTDSQGRFALTIKKSEQSSLGLLVISESGDYQDAVMEDLAWNDQYHDVMLDANSSAVEYFSITKKDSLVAYDWMLTGDVSVSLDPGIFTHWETIIAGGTSWIDNRPNPFDDLSQPKNVSSDGHGINDAKNNQHKPAPYSTPFSNSLLPISAVRMRKDKKGSTKK